MIPKNFIRAWRKAESIKAYIFIAQIHVAMSAKKTGFENSLLTEVVETGKCASCGSCVVNCPFGCLELAKGKPNLVKECKVCGICSQACPRYNWAMGKAEDFVYGRIRKPAGRIRSLPQNCCRAGKTQRHLESPPRRGSSHRNVGGCLEKRVN